MIEPFVDQHLQLCQLCEEEVFYAVDRKGNWHLLNAHHDRVPGNFVVSAHDGKLYAGEVRWNQAASMRQAGRPLYSQHEATCAKRRDIQDDRPRSAPRPYPVPQQGTPQQPYCCERAGKQFRCSRCPLRQASLEWQARRRYERSATR